MAVFKPIRIKQAEVAAYPKKSGQVIFCTDTPDFYVDISDSERKGYQEITSLTSAERGDILVPVKGFYFETDTYKLWYFTGAEWVEPFGLNADELAVTYSDISELTDLKSGETLSSAFGKLKLAVSKLIAHLKDYSNPHKVTKDQVGLGSVENKSGATIRGEMTKAEVVKALGYTPPEKDTNTVYSIATPDVAGLVKSGGDIEVQDDGVMSLLGRVGKNVEGDSYTVEDEPVTAEVGAEIFNDYENNKAGGEYSHAEGTGTIATGKHQHVQGRYNVNDGENKYAHIVGNGTNDESRSNAHTVDWDGNAWYAGKVSAGTAESPSTPTQAHDLVTKKYADEIKTSVTSTINSHTGNKSNPHGVTKSQIGLGNVENKSGATIRSEMTKDEVVKALGYTPPEKDTNTTYNPATTSTNGLMSAADKKKLDGIAEGANKYVHPAYTAKASGLYKVTVDATGHVSGTAVVAKADITALGIPAQDTTYGAATTSTPGLMSAADKTKLDGIATGANKYVHPSYTAKAAGLYKVTVDATGHVSKADTVTKADITNLGIPAQDTTYGVASGSSNGLMSSADKTKLDGIAAGANKYTHPTYTEKSAGLYKVTVDGTGHVSKADAVTKADITGLGIPGQDTTYSPASSSANGLMSAADKKKLDGIAEGANKYTHPTYSAKSSGLYKITVDATGHVSAASTVTKQDILNLGFKEDVGYTKVIGGEDLGGAAPSGSDSSAQFTTVPISLTTTSTTLANFTLDDLPLGMYSILIRLKLSAVSSSSKVLQLKAGSDTFQIAPNMLSSANKYCTIGFIASHTSKGALTVSLKRNTTTINGVSGALDYIMVTPAATAIYSAQ